MSVSTTCGKNRSPNSVAANGRCSRSRSFSRSWCSNLPRSTFWTKSTRRWICLILRTLVECSSIILRNLNSSLYPWKRECSTTRTLCSVHALWTEWAQCLAPLVCKRGNRARLVPHLQFDGRMSISESPTDCDSHLHQYIKCSSWNEYALRWWILIKIGYGKHIRTWQSESSKCRVPYIWIPFVYMLTARFRTRLIGTARQS